MNLQVHIPLTKCTLCQDKNLQKRRTFLQLHIDTGCGKCLHSDMCYPLPIVCTIYFIN